MGCERAGRPVGAHGLEQVVGGAQVERVDGVALVGGDEHDLGWGGEPAEDAGEVEAVEAGHPDVAEHRVEGLGVQGPQRLGAVADGADEPYPRVGAEQPGELVAGRCLVVHDQHRERARPGGQRRVGCWWAER
jgi:hypothetical protein